MKLNNYLAIVICICSAIMAGISFPSSESAVWIIALAGWIDHVFDRELV
jgi:hypothetical protein